MAGGGIGSVPLMTDRSEWQTPLAVTCTTTSRGPGSVAVTSSTARSPSCSTKIAARMWMSFSRRGPVLMPAAKVSGAGPEVKRQPDGRHALPGEHVAGQPVGGEQGPAVGPAEAAVRRHPAPGQAQEVELGA